MLRFIGFSEAYQLTLARVPRMESHTLSLDQATGSVLAQDVTAQVNSPSMDVSLKDGYAVVSSDLALASDKKPIQLTICGSVNAGQVSEHSITTGQAMRITTGAPLPAGATAVLAEEFCRKNGDLLTCLNTAEIGRNILPQGTDIERGRIIASRHEKIAPAWIGLLISAGIARVSVYRSPRVAVIGTGDEIVAPGATLGKGELYASNVAAICAWLGVYGFNYQVTLVRDNPDLIQQAVENHLPHVDAFLTSGGIWGSEKDYMLKALNRFNWKPVYHRVRLGPGKAVAFGLLNHKPFFSLPGGPPSNEMAFLQLALPGLLAMKGDGSPPFNRIAAELTETVQAVNDWTQFIHAQIFQKNERLYVTPYKPKSRLVGMARKDALINIPEGKTELKRGDTILIQQLR